MDESEKLKLEVQEGRIDAARIVDLVVTLQRQLQAAQQQIQAAQQQIQAAQQQLQTANERVAQLEKQHTPTTAKLDVPFSMRAEEQRQETRGKTKKRKPKHKKQ